jgi:hypothetical protein
MAIRNRFLAFFYRLILLGIGGYATYLLFSFRSLSPEWWRGFYYYDCQTLLFATAIVFAEVVANAIGLNKKTNGIVPGVWSPLFIASLSFTLFDLGGYAILSSSTNSGFFAATDIKVMLLSKIIFPALLLGDYLLFGEKGTVKWKHPIFWSLYPLFYFAFSLLVKAVWQQGFSAVSFFTPSTFQTGADALTGNGGWNGVVLSSLLAYLCYFALAYLLVFLNNVFAGAYRKRTPSDVI